MAGTTVLLWAPFVLHNQGDMLYRYWDGPSYVTVANSMYSVNSTIYAIYGFGPTFYAAHFPAYPLAIRLLSFIGYFPAMLLCTLLFAISSVLLLYELAQRYTDKKTAFYLSAIFTVFPARWIIYHSVGATEPLFITAILACLLLFERRQYPWAAMAGAVAALTRVNGVLLFPALIAALWFNRKDFTLRNVACLSAIPIAVLGLFTFYFLNFGDFFAAFSYNQKYVQGLFSAITQYGGPQAGELTVILYGLYLIGVARLWQKNHRTLALTSAALVIPLLFVAHNDISRYLLPAAPMAILIAWNDTLSPLFKSKVFWLAIILFAAAGYVYAWNVMSQDVWYTFMPHDTFLRLAAFVGR